MTILEMPPRARPLTAAAVNLADGVNTPELARQLKRHQAWQQDAAGYFSEIGEIHYVVNRAAAALSEATLYAATLSESGAVVPVDAPESSVSPGVAAVAQQVLAELRSPVGGQKQIVHQAYVNAEIPGEFFLIDASEDGGEPAWWVRSILETTIREPGQPVSIRGIGDVPYDSVSRVWRPHPMRFEAADSGMRPILSNCELVILIDRQFRAAMKSRLFAGLLLLPSGLRQGVTDISQKNDPRADPIVVDFLDALNEAIGEEGSASAVTPNFLWGAVDDINAVRRVEFAQQIDPEVLKLRDSAITRIVQGLEYPSGILQEAEANHWCVDEATEAFTSDGWKHHDELAVGDVVLTLNHETGLSEWQPVDRLYRADVVDEPMLSMETRFHSSLTTANHRWPVIAHTSRDYSPATRRTWRTSETLKANDDILRGAQCADVPTDAKYSDALVELVGWFWTEGSYRDRPGRHAPNTHIYQSQVANPDNCDRIRRALTALCGPASESLGRGGRGTVAESQPPRWREVSRAGGMVVFKLNKAASAALVDIAPNRMVSLDFIRALTYSQLRLFIEVSALADGGTNGAGVMVAQKDPAMLAAVEMAAILSGSATYRYDAVSHGFTDHVSHKVGIAANRPTTPRPRHKTWTTYSGVVWCPTTSNGTWFARRNGRPFFTGNSAWFVGDSFIEHIRPKGDFLADGFTTVFQRPGMEARGVPFEEASKVFLAFDYSALARKPNIVEVATLAHDRYVISDESLRRDLGYDEDDAPEPEEVAERVARRQVKAGVPGEVTGPPSEGAVTASAFSNTLGGRLTRLDAELRERLLGATIGAIRRATEKAGNRAKSKVASAHREAVATVSASDVCAQLGPTLLAAAGVTEDELLDGGVDGLEKDYRRWTEAAAVAALALTGVTLAGEQLAAWRLRMLSNVEASWEWFSGELRGTLNRLLMVGGDPSEAALKALVRMAVAAAGGATELGVTGGGLIPISAVTGIGTGSLTLDTLTEAGGSVDGWRWVHDSPEHPFEPHVALDGAEAATVDEFAGFADGTFDTWPGGHAGCACDLELIARRPDD